MKCSKCGKVFPSDAMFCDVCGDKLEEGTEVNETVVDDNTQTDDTTENIISSSTSSNHINYKAGMEMCIAVSIIAVIAVLSLISKWVDVRIISYFGDGAGIASLFDISELLDTLGSYSGEGDISSFSTFILLVVSTCLILWAAVVINIWLTREVNIPLHYFAAGGSIATAAIVFVFMIYINTELSYYMDYSVSAVAPTIAPFLTVIASIALFVAIKMNEQGKLNFAGSANMPNMSSLSAAIPIDAIRNFEKVECHKCGTINSGKNTFCAECGERIKAPDRFCATCGKKLNPGVKFCPDCGAKYEAVLDEAKVDEVNNTLEIKEAKCESCGTILEPGAKFCPECGEGIGASVSVSDIELTAQGEVDEITPIEEIKNRQNEQVCKQCGTMVAEHARFCPKCGELVNEV